MSEIVSTDRVQQIQLDVLKQGYAQLPHVLNIMGFPSLRPGQEPVIINMMAQRDTICVLPTGCHAKGQKIKVYGPDIHKSVEDIRVGQLIYGWDGTIRTVTHLKTGVAPCSRIVSSDGTVMTVTNNHTLTLRHKDNGHIYDITVDEYNKSNLKDKLELFRVYSPGYPYISDTRSFVVEDAGEQEFFGFTITGDGRYLLDDFTVDHNTGKSGCFVIPTLCLNWRTIVFSPLVALMRDQVQSLGAKGIKAQAVSSVQSESENIAALRRWAEGDLQFLYVAPERLHNELFKDAVSRVKPDAIVVDEAHVASKDAYNFRSSYCLIGDFIAQHNPKVVAAFTATCTAEVEKDIRRIFHMENASKLIYYPRRNNLILKSEDLMSDSQLADFVYDVKGSVIVYCSTIKRVEQIAKQLTDWLREDVIVYHGELAPTDKKVNQDLFMNDKIRVIAATNAFGMGIDKAQVRGVVFRDIPGSIEELSQGLGRAGRDGKDSLCMTFFSPDSYNTQKFFIENSHPTKSEIYSVLRVLELAADSEGVSQLTIADICKKTNLFSKKVPAILETLKSGRVIEREKSGEKIARIRLDDGIPEDDARFDKWIEIIKDYGMEEDGFYNIDLNWLADHIGLGYVTITNHLKRWDEENAIRYIPPFRGSATRIVGSIANIDFAALTQRASAAHAKLDQVVEYIKIPDIDKHTYLEKYFEIYK